MKYINRILLFISLFFIYIIIRELLELYILIRSIHPIAGYFSIIIIFAAVFYLVLLPIYRIIKIPIYNGPTKDKSKEAQLIDEKIEYSKNNPYLKSINFDFTTSTNNRQLYDEIITKFTPECNKIRAKYVSQLFYTSSISQNGFIDAILILSSSISLVKEIFILYNGRVSNKDLISIGKKVYYSMAIGGSEGVEYATEEIVSKLASNSIKSIPFIEKILGSLTDGFVNAVLLNRISYITENYCKLTYIQSDRDLNPSAKFIATATKNITADITDRLTTVMRKMAIDKPLDIAMAAVNPIKYLYTKTIDKANENDNSADSKFKNSLKEGFAVVTSPFTYVTEKLFSSLKKNN